MNHVPRTDVGIPFCSGTGSFPELRKAKPGKEIRRGAYSKVFEIVYEKRRYAAKQVHTVLFEGTGQIDDIQKAKTDLLRECHIWAQLQNPCIVRFIG